MSNIAELIDVTSEFSKIDVEFSRDTCIFQYVNNLWKMKDRYYM